MKQDTKIAIAVVAVLVIAIALYFAFKKPKADNTTDNTNNQPHVPVPQPKANWVTAVLPGLEQAAIGFFGYKFGNQNNPNNTNQYITPEMQADAAAHVGG